VLASESLWPPLGKSLAVATPQGTLTPNTTTQMVEFIWAAGGDPPALNDRGSVQALTFPRQLAPYLAPETRRADWNTTNAFLATESVYLARNWPFGIQGASAADPSPTTSSGWGCRRLLWGRARVPPEIVAMLAASWAPSSRLRHRGRIPHVSAHAVSP
jgi:hypothetical protein